MTTIATHTSADTTSTAAPNPLAQHFLQTRRFTDRLVEPLSAEDCMVQSMDDVSPTRWHLAHTTWFFETFALKEEPGYEVFDETFNYLFNSYYNTIGAQFPRPRRGVLSRPGLEEIKRYREYVDAQVIERLASPKYAERMRDIIEVGIHHEQQHQELILTDIKHVLACNPLFPAYRSDPFDRAEKPEQEWLSISAGNYDVGYEGEGFAYDNESPRHRVYLNDFRIAKNLVTNGDYIEFIEDGGYERPELWLSLGWSTVQEEQWNAPLYWMKQDGDWKQFTLAGLTPVNRDWPVCHISLFEADAFARWAGKRLPTEFEWEVAATQLLADDLTTEPFADTLLDSNLALHPTRSPAGMLGSVWQWTNSSYQAYPGYRPPEGALGEYNGKFMCNQYILRGGSIATSSNHIRTTYRNFFPASTRWQFSGVRLTQDGT